MGEYKIERFIASGGFGCTYEAHHTLSDTLVAMKEFFNRRLLPIVKNRREQEMWPRNQMSVVRLLEE